MKILVCVLLNLEDVYQNHNSCAQLGRFPIIGRGMVFPWDKGDIRKRDQRMRKFRKYCTLYNLWPNLYLIFIDFKGLWSQPRALLKLWRHVIDYGLETLCIPDISHHRHHWRWRTFFQKECKRDCFEQSLFREYKHKSAHF